MVYNRLRLLKRWFIPRHCVVCDAEAGDDALCDPCRETLPRIDAGCARCAAPLPGATAGLHVCGRCQTRPPNYDQAQARYRYAAPIDRLVQGFKYQRRLDWGRVLGEALAQQLQAMGARAEAIVPVPLHRRRLRERGYNQSAELARPVGRLLGIPVLTRAAYRVRPTPAQTGLSRDERRRNVRNAFEIAQQTEIADKHVAIVDDVMTSGHTVDALARALKRAGATEVSVWVVARA